MGDLWAYLWLANGSGSVSAPASGQNCNGGSQSGPLSLLRQLRRHHRGRLQLRHLDPAPAAGLRSGRLGPAGLHQPGLALSVGPELLHL